MNIIDLLPLAKHLTPPLLLVALALYFGFSIHSKMLDKGVLSKPNSKDSGRIKLKILQYGFWVILIMAILALGLSIVSIWTSHTQAGP